MSETLDKTSFVLSVIAVLISIWPEVLKIVNGFSPRALYAEFQTHLATVRGAVKDYVPKGDVRSLFEDELEE